LLIIFDLDDTLIDTTGSITPVKLEQALSKMVEAGLHVGDFQEALTVLKRLDTAADSASQTLLEFLEIMNDKKFYEIGHAEVYGPLPQDFPVYPIDQAIDLLLDLSLEHQLALVSMGNPAQQMLKLKNAGIDSTIFSKICISEDRDKKPHYKIILEELGFAPAQTLVCGDRVKRDLSPAKELGCITVHMQWGRGLSSPLSSLPHCIARDVDHVIKNLREIKDILTNYDKQ